MARIRTIKPEFPQSESMGRVSRDARLTFILLWTIADDSGRLRGSSRMLASLLFPYDDDAKRGIDKWLAELESVGCVRRYVVDGNAYVDLPNWLAHQKIDKPSQSKFPPFATIREDSPNAREDSSEDQGPRTKEGTKDQGPGAGGDSRSLATARPTIEQVQAYCLERGKHVDPQAWFDHYTANGWRVGKNPMKDWKAAVRTWERNGVGNGASVNHRKGPSIGPGQSFGGAKDVVVGDM